MTACVLGLALLAGGAFLVLDQGSGGSGTEAADVPSSALDVAWETGELPRSTAGSGTYVPWPGHWAHDSLFVYGDEHGVRAYDFTTGQKKWQVEPPEGAGEPCAMSPTASPGGVGAVLFDAGGDECAFLAAVDVDTGSVLWDRKLATEYGTNGPRVQAGDKNITVSLNSVENLQMFAVQSGAPRDPFASVEIECRFSYVFSARHIVAKPECRDELIVLDTENGGDAVAVSDQHGKPVRVLSDAPLTVAVDTEDRDGSPMRLLNIDEYGEKAEAVELTGPAAEVVFRAKGNGVTPDGRYYFAKLATGGSDVILDLKSGEVSWKAGSAQTSFIGYDDSGERVLVAEADEEKNYWTRVAAVDPATGKASYAGTMVTPDGTYLHQSRAVYAYDGSTVVAAGDRSQDGSRMIQAFDVDLPAS